MEFGKLHDISQVNFELPPTVAETIKLLESLPPNIQQSTQKTDFYVGCPVWACKDWLGTIYPKSINEKQYLYHYTRQFNTIELNTTHYRTPDTQTIRKWKEQSAANFRFCPKLLQSITHEHKLLGNEAQRLTDEFLRQVEGLEDNLGIVFMQLPPYFSPSNFSALENFIKILPKNIPFAIEFRHEAWFYPQKSSNSFENAAQLLENHGIATVICDVAGRRDVLHQRLATDTLVLRFVGNGLHKTDYERTDEWIQKLVTWQKIGLKSAYLFIHEPSGILAPEMAAYWIQELNKHCGSKLKKPHFYTTNVQQSLF
jgi:uncharacterized protein YecE (DUF72 family)